MQKYNKSDAHENNYERLKCYSNNFLFYLFGIRVKFYIQNLSANMRQVLFILGHSMSV
jgi:hypothetical protein